MRRLADPALLLVLAVALTVRAWLLLRAGGPVLDADEAVVGLMASHILEGGGLPLYYYGQDYLGALESWLVALVFLVTGPSALGLRMVPAVTSVISTGLVYSLGARVASRRAGFLAALLFAVPPAGLAAWSLKARGGFIEIVAIGTGALIATDALVAGAAGAGTAFVLGALLAFGWWINQQIIYYAVPWLLVLAWQHRRDQELLGRTIPVGAGLLAAALLLRIPRPDAVELRLLLAGTLVLTSAGGAFLLRSGRLAPLIPLFSSVAGIADDLPGLHGHPIVERVLFTAAALAFAFRSSPREAALLGASLAAFSWWNPASPIYAAAAFAVPLLGATVAVLSRPLARAFAAGAVVGGIPFLAGLLTRGGNLFDVVRQGSPLDAVSHLAGFVTVSLPMLVGARPFWGDTDFVPGLSVVAVGVYAVTLPFFLRALSPVRRLVYGGFLLGVPLVFSSSAFGWFVREPRYLLPIYSVLFLVPAVVSDRALLAGRRLAPAAIFATLLTVHALGLAERRTADDLLQLTDTERVSADHSGLISFLEKRGIDRIYTDYWIGYRLAFETGEQVWFAPFEQPSTERIASYGRAVRRAEDPAWVLPPSRAAIAASALDRLGVGYRRSSASGYTILHSLEGPSDHPGCEPLEPGSLEIGASHAPGELPFLVDGDPTTRWATHTPQRPGQWLEVAFDRPRRLCWLSLTNGDFVADHPRGIRILVGSPPGPAEVIVDSGRDGEIRYWLQGGRFGTDLGGIEAGALRIEQTGTADPFDWSVVELEVFAEPEDPSAASGPGAPESARRRDQAAGRAG